MNMNSKFNQNITSGKGSKIDFIIFFTSKAYIWTFCFHEIHLISLVTLSTSNYMLQNLREWRLNPPIRKNLKVINNSLYIYANNFVKTFSEVGPFLNQQREVITVLKNKVHKRKYTKVYRPEEFFNKMDDNHKISDVREAINHI